MCVCVCVCVCVCFQRMEDVHTTKSCSAKQKSMFLFPNILAIPQIIPCLKHSLILLTGSCLKNRSLLFAAASHTELIYFLEKEIVPGHPYWEPTSLCWVSRPSANNSREVDDKELSYHQEGKKQAYNIGNPSVPGERLGHPSCILSESLSKTLLFFSFFCLWPRIRQLSWSLPHQILTWAPKGNNWSPFFCFLLGLVHNRH